jgi:purine-cytosine permease-like protein
MSDEPSTAAPAEETQGVNEYEREPVPRKSLLGFKSFVGMYAGEHCAGTELMIGPLFVAAGVSAFDLIVGLLLGNLLAVLSWRFLTAPIATRARLTLYYQLEKICGRHLVILYNLANGVMFCFLAGAMITVSATAVGVWIKFPMPGLNDLYPNSIGWVLAVLGVGLVISLVAAFGYKMVSRVANIAAPWMVLVFLAFGFVAFQNFVHATGTDIRSAGDVWALCETAIWKGGEPLPGKIKFTLWHVMFFAWFCNMAMHIGMADLTVFRYARKSWYAVASGAGMYVGHFMAWICAAMLFAYQLHESRPDQHMIDLLVAHGESSYTQEQLEDAPLTSELLRQAMDIENRLVEQGTIKPEDKQVSVPTPLPGPLANNALGLVGLLCVIIAGWTTANPTIYRAGLAFQAIMPKRSRFTVTLLTGGIATVAGMFPAIAMKLLDFVALYGMVLMPMGAVVFVDFWLIRRFGLKSNYAQWSKQNFNWAAGLTWFVTFGVCLTLVFSGIPAFQIYFVSLPGWFVAAALYIVISAIYQNQVHQTPVFRLVCQAISWVSIVLLVVPGVLYLLGRVELDQVKYVMLSATAAWFAATPLWMGLKKERSSESDETPAG